ncbi:MAG: pyridoxamine 5'-phosphate oxidase family protein, partial [Micrococcales bacterium]|nr:pyridoxamine 5'-phosphate oxidase family protein [Micrococcales bacterium]
MLAPRRREGLREFWLTTNTSSMRVAQFQANPQAAIYFADQQRFLGVMLRGHMAVCQDAASKEMIWRAGDHQYYSQGVTDPDYCVLHFTARDGRYYAGFSSRDFQVT